MSMEKEFTLRSYKSSDIAGVVAVVNAATAQSMGIQCAVIDAVGNLRLSRYVPLTSEKVVVTDLQDQVIAYAYLVDREQAIVYELGGGVHPDYWGQGIGSMLLDWAEQKTQILSKQAPEGVKTVLQTNIFEVEQAAIGLFTGRAYSKVREWMHLVIELDAAPILPVIPDGLYLREMNLDEDWDLVAPAMDEAFADHWGAILLAQEDTSETEDDDDLPEDDDDLPEDDSYSNAQGFCFLLMDDNLVAGGILCNNKLVERNDTGRVGSIFVRPNYRRRGVGRALMLTAFHCFWQHGFRRIICDTDAESFSESPKFYADLGMREYRREFLYEKTIRDGKEARRLNL